MAAPQKPAGIDVPLLESLVKKHFGAESTGKLAWSVTKGRYVRSDVPRRLAVPQKLFGIRLWWHTVGELSENIGFRLELWRPEYLSQATALVTEYNAATQGAKLEFSPSAMRAPVGRRPAVV